MPVLDSYLFFSGNCAPAIRFYETTLGAKREFVMTFGESPQAKEFGPEVKDRIMHASLLLGDRRLMASDTPPGYPTPPMTGFALSLTSATADEARKVFAALSAGGKVTVPIDKTFWAEAFGMLVDQFGTPWMVSSPPQK